MHLTIISALTVTIFAMISQCMVSVAASVARLASPLRGASLTVARFASLTAGVARLTAASLTAGECEALGSAHRSRAWRASPLGSMASAGVAHRWGAWRALGLLSIAHRSRALGLLTAARRFATLTAGVAVDTVSAASLTGEARRWGCCRLRGASLTALEPLGSARRFASLGLLSIRCERSEAL